MHVLKPRRSEKAYATSLMSNTFVLDVPGELNKHEIAAAVTKQFEVTVTNVRTINRKGKQKRVVNTTGRRSTNRRGSQRDIKKAYVTLAAGSHLPFFEAEEADKAAADEKATKQARKGTIVAPAKPAAGADHKTGHRSLLRSRKSGEK